MDNKKIDFFLESETLKVESISQTNGKKHSNSTDHANHCGK